MVEHEHADVRHSWEPALPGRRLTSLSDFRYRRTFIAAFIASLTFALLGLPLAPGSSAPALAAPTPSSGYSLSLVASGIREPHTLRTAPDGRIFLLQQSGRVRVVKRDRLLLKPALVIDSADIVALNNSSGLLGIAFPPDFKTAATQHVYLLYTHTPMTGYEYRHNVVSRWVIEGNVIDPASEEILVHLDPLVNDTGGFATSHYGGDMEFGSDGMLYVTTGDLYTASNGQRLDNRLGKILRYEPTGSIPTDNPFYDTASGPNRAIWSYGLRNPFKLARDPRSGRMLLGDVGSSRFEEVNVVEPGVAGANYGWADTEGYTTDPQYVSPILAYPHTATGSGLSGCAVMGGDIYRPKTATFPGIGGDFIFADHCEGWVRTIDPRTGAIGPELASGLYLPVDMAVARTGSVWLIQRHLADGFPGGLFRLDYVGSAAAPVINTQPENAAAAIGGSATFTVYASGSAPLSYQWYRDGTAVLGATAPTYTLADVALTDDAAEFTVEVSNSVGSVTSGPAVLDVIDDRSPVPTITSPVVGASFAAGDVLHLAGTAVDAEDGTLPASAFEWDVDLHHNVHVHDVVGPVTGVTQLDVELSRTEETDTDIFYRVSLKVTDSSGVSTTVTRDVTPSLTTFSVASVPNLLAVDLDGVTNTTPFTVPSVVGTRRNLNAVPVTRSGSLWVFDSWFGGSTQQSRTFNVPPAAETYQAFFRLDGGSVGTGSGLLATYFDDVAMTSPVVQRIDRVPYFDWPNEPVPGVPKDDFGVMWEGELEAQFTGTYTFTAPMNRDETLLLRVGSQTVLDVDTVNGVVAGSTSLTAGQRYPIEIAYTDDNGAAALKLTYGRTTTTMGPLPGSQLYPAP
jgi:glucose/arabinose dehydrogenase